LIGGALALSPLAQAAEGSGSVTYVTTWTQLMKQPGGRALQLWLGHRNIQHTVRYTELSPARFKSFWRD